MSEKEAGLAPIRNMNDFFLSIRKGILPGQELIRVEGRQQDLDEALRTVWEQLSVYNFSAAATAYQISSSNNGDDQDIKVITHDLNNAKVEATRTLNGQTAVAAGSNLRAISIENIDDTDLAGDVYLYETTALTDGVPDDLTKVRAKIVSDELIQPNRSMMAVYTVPAGKTAYIVGADSNIVDYLQLQVRQPGGIFRNWNSLERIPEKSDIWIVSQDSSGEVIASFDLLLIDN